MISAPIQSDLNEGRQIHARGKGIDRTEKDAKIVIGKWFNGRSQELVEEMIFLTPGLLSRWLGYQLSDGNTMQEVQNTWEKCSAQFSNRTHAVIRLARLCKIDPTDGEIDNSAKPECLDEVSIQIHQRSKPWIPINFRVVQDIQQRRPSEVLNDSWDEVLAKFTVWPSKPTDNDLMPDIRWGRNRRISLIAQTPTLEPGSKCELKITEKDRTRIIPFVFPRS